MTSASVKKQFRPAQYQRPLQFKDDGLDNLVGRIVTSAQQIRFPNRVNEQAFSWVVENLAEPLRLAGRLFLLSDAVALMLAFGCGGLAAWAIDMHILHNGFQQLFDAQALGQFTIFLGLGLLSLLWLDMKGHYRQRLPYWETLGHILAVGCIGFLVGGFIQFASKATFSRLWLTMNWGFLIVFILTGRAFVRRSLAREGKWQIPTIVIGDGPTAEAALRALKGEKAMGFKIVKQVPSTVLENLAEPFAWKKYMAANGAGYLFLALEGREVEQHHKALAVMVRERVSYSIVPPWLGLPSSTLSQHSFMMHDVLLLQDTNRLQLPLPQVVKRCFDILLSGAGLFALLPVLAVVALIVRSDGGPAFFGQQRVGRNGRLFNCYKFRSMRVDAEEVLAKYLAENPAAAAEWATYQKLQQDVRVTRFGAFIRRFSIDELPQLFNVLKGDMSLVGPRPIMLGQEEYYADDLSYYEAVRPGISGPWQVSGRNKLTFQERVSLESWYVRNWSLWMDIVIILKTVPVLLRRENAF